MLLAWGAELNCIYNDAYRDVLIENHPQSLGMPFRELWAENWRDIFPLVDQALAGESPYQEDRAMVVRRNGRDEHLWFTFSLSPAFNDEDRIGGVVCTVIETTERVQAEHRHTFQLKLADTLRVLSQPQEVTTAAAKLIGEYFQADRVGYADVDEMNGTMSIICDYTNGTTSSLAGQTRQLNSLGPHILGTLRAGKTLSLSDIATDGRVAAYVRAHALEGVQAMLTVPLVEGNRLTSILFLQEEQARQWTDEQIMLVEDVARRTWDAAKRSHREEQLREESHILEMLYDTGKEVASTLDMRTLLQTITDRATALSGAQFGAFFYSPQKEDGPAAMLYTLSGAPREAFEKLGLVRPTPILAPLLHGARAIRSDDILVDPLYGQKPPHNGMPNGHLAVRSYLAVPVLLRSGESAGGLIFGHPEPAMFNERTERIVIAVAAQAATALDNARLYEDAKRAAKERQALLARERAARSEAENLSKAKDEFLAMLAHELRNPLAPISSAAELLARVQLDANRIQATSKIIVRQVKHMTGLIDDLLDVSRVTRGLVALSKEVVDLKQVVTDAVEQVRPALDARQHQLSLQLAPDSVPVQGDHKRLVQVLANILGNAVKYTPEGGHIEVRLEVAGGDVVVHITDNGLGMAPELLPNIFGLFTQAERTPDRSQGGLGLGLALVKSLVQLHGGTVSATSAGLGHGSTFSVQLPRLVEGPMPEVPDVGQILPGAFHPLQVLVVDDNTDAAATLTLFLEAEGHLVTELHSSEAALGKAQEHKFHACLLDIGLPGMDGLELASRLRQLPTTKDALFIAVTGYGRQTDRDNAFTAGFDHYVVKPAKATELIALLADATHPV